MFHALHKVDISFCCAKQKINLDCPDTTLFISLHKNSNRAASVPHFILPSNIVVSSVNSLNSSYVARTKHVSFKKTKSLVMKSLALFKTSVCINSCLSGTFSNGAVFDSTNTSHYCAAIVQYSISNFKHVADLDSFNSGDEIFSSFVTTKCFLTFLSLLISFLTSCYLSK